ncbi:hypothetical protein TNCV_3055981 [Trichonephila clavipes]|nr:hypothetical protein TNCV_3055981 [Trichonephila clavipes]
MPSPGFEPTPDGTAFGMYGWFTKYRFRCEPIDFSDNSDALKMVQVCWVFYASKLVELSDTRCSALLVERLRQQTKLPHLSEANPQVYVETPLHPEKLTVWCALWAGGILLQKR